MSQDQPFIWKSSLGAPEVGWGGASRNLQGGSDSVSQADLVSDMAQLAGSVWMGVVSLIQ